MATKSRPIDSQSELRKLNPSFEKYQLQLLFPIAVGNVTLSTGGGVQVVTDTNIAAGDIALVTLASDDTGTTIIHLHGAITADTLTITRTDDGSSNDDAVANNGTYRNA